MSDSLRVTFAVWRDASTDPPKRDTERYWWTDEGEASWGLTNENVTSGTAN